MWLYITEHAFEGELLAIRKVKSETEDTDGQAHYFKGHITIWESEKGKNYDVFSTPYYKENLFRNSEEFRKLIDLIFRKI